MPWKEKNQAKINVPEGVKNEGAYKNLINQVNKTARHNRQGSFKTKDRYYDAVERFTRHLADHYNLQKMNNASGKHLASYVQEMQSKGLSASTIKTDLAAIRFYHDKFEKTRYILPNNKELKERFGINLERRVFGGVDRKWSHMEYQSMVTHAKNLGREDIAHVMQLAREQGLRLHEAVRLDRAAAEQALRENMLTVKGKGGLVRSIPLREEGRAVLQEAIKNVERGQKLFVPEEKRAHEVMKSIQSFVENHREKFAEEDRVSNMTFHGLRHSFAREEYEARIKQGIGEERARLEVAELLGHGREDVTRIYLAE